MKRITSNSEVVLAVTGSIAAYKSCDLASRLVEAGARVIPVLTRAAREFVGPASLEAITGQRAIVEMFEPLQNPEVEHIAVATRARLFIIAPATANVIAKAAVGLADDWLSTTLLATRAPILFAPAMNSDMYTHPATQANIQTLEGRGSRFVGPGSGRLACRAIGIGRMVDPQVILEAALPLLSEKNELAGKHVLLTSGPTQEPIDPIRFISNRSSGKTGRALAMEALCRGAKVTVVTGPADVPLPYGATVREVRTAEEMGRAVAELADDADIVIGAAAVADYRPQTPLADKLKKCGKTIAIPLVENKDIIAETAARKRPGQFIVGFAAETTDLLEHAGRKLRDKRLDLLVACQVGRPDTGFGADALDAVLLAADGTATELRRIAKEELAEMLFDRLVRLFG